MRDPPVLEVGDYLLDDPADLVDLAIELFLPVEQLAAGRLSERSDHAVADIAGVTLDMCVTLLTALADGLTARAITDASSVFDGQRRRFLLGAGAIALISSCVEPDSRADGLSLEESAAAIIRGRS